MTESTALRIERSSDWLFLAWLDGVQVARCSIAAGDGVWEVYSTVVDPAHEGRGIASRLVQFVLESAESAGVSVIPSCWYVDGWMQRHGPRFERLRHGTQPPPTDAGDPQCRIAPAVIERQS